MYIPQQQFQVFKDFDLQMKKTEVLLIALLHEILPAKNLRMLEEQSPNHEKVTIQFEDKAQVKRETENKN